MNDTTKQETHTLQVWPSGRGYEYRGDPNGPAEQRSLRTERKHLDPTDWDGPACLRWLAEHTKEPNHYAARADDWAGEVARFAEYEGRDPAVTLPEEEWEQRTVDELQRFVVERMEVFSWRDGQPDEWREILYSVRAERYQDRDVLGCDSMLVDDLIKGAQSGGGPFESDLGEAFSDEGIRNLYPDPEDWDAPACREWLEDHLSIDDYDPEDAEDDLRASIRDRAEPAEVLEWWRVTSWLCDQLHAIGEVTIDNSYGYWWGRCATGQRYIMDGVLQKVAAQFD